MEEKEKVVAPNSDEEVVEIEDVDLGLGEKDVQKVKAEVEKKVVENHVLNKEQQKIFSRIMDEAHMPVHFSDSKFKLGENELDIRDLSKKNKEQMTFRQSTLELVYLKQILTTLIDISRLLMVVADKLGVEDIIAATDVVIEKTMKANKINEKLGQEDTTENKA